ncbi:hypothetical protein [Acinetobacter towneri]|uniref:hypothetical protein n=1 Tax=Acinetobacter towneri TaxID=202956 RepID=UPI001CE0F551|nr:hypothetical protein [Acinetobacter towneri]MCA4788993.1 hypothetical protein [Acinetobacter towneri]
MKLTPINSIKLKGHGSLLDPGDAKIKGVIKRMGGVVISPCFVFLFEREGMYPVDRLATNKNGEYEFIGLNKNYKYSVVAVDSSRTYNAVIQDNVVPK